MMHPWRFPLGLVLAIAGSVVTAQQPTQKPAAKIDTVPRLTVRPHAMILGTRTATAGLTKLMPDSLPGYYLYVPPSCVGTKRCPLALLLHGAGGNGFGQVGTMIPEADKHGIIVLAANATLPGEWDLIGGLEGENTYLRDTPAGVEVRQFEEWDVRNIDRALNHVLSTNAIDPDRIAVFGFSDGGSYSLFLGRANEDIFSRVVAQSGLPLISNGPRNTKTQFLIAAGTDEGLVPQMLIVAHALRQEGYPVVSRVELRGHIALMEDQRYAWDWLDQSWANPSITTNPPLSTDPDPVLTEAAMKKMTRFWTKFMDVPDSVADGRIAHQHLLWLALGTDSAADVTSVLTIDMPSFAAAYPAVAADLKAAGLTPKQEDAYRRALLRVGFIHFAQGHSENIPNALPFLLPIAPNSVIGQNLAFRAAHLDAFKGLAQTDFWKVQDGNLMRSLIRSGQVKTGPPPTDNQR